MKNRTIILVFTIFLSLRLLGNDQPITVDSIMKRVMQTSENYNDFVESFNAKVYLRAYVETIKKNFLYKHTHFIPRFVLNDPKSDEALMETIGTLNYNFPNHYTQQIEAVTGTLTKKRDIEMLPYSLLNINVYSESTADENQFLPLRFGTAKYYSYKLKQTYSENGKTYFTVDYTPKHEHPKLLKGSFIVEDGTWRIIRFSGEGIDILGRFVIELTMGNESYGKFLPEKFTIYQTVSYLGNVVSYRYLAKIDYLSITLREKPYRWKKELNVSEHYSIKMDSVPINNDSVFWNHNRPIPLQAKEADVISDFIDRKAPDSITIVTDTLTFLQQTLKIGELLTQDFDYSYKLSKLGYKGFLNPSLLGFSTKDGITFRQKASFTQDLYHEKLLKINLFLGYLFKRNELYTDLSTTWNYNPRRLGRVSLSLGNRNATYSTNFREQIKDILKEEGITYDSLLIDYYKDYYFRLANNIEITNGFQIGVGMEYHIRKGREKPILNPTVPINNEPMNDIDDLFGKKKYFVPFIQLTWTPEQYYRLEGKQKIYVRSPYPTFQIEYSKSIKDVFNSTSEYDRIEFDICQHIQLGLMKSINYRVGAGKFMNQTNEYFSDFAYFTKNNFPEVWNSDIGGCFSLLSRNLYNASDSYIQAHLMYETPFIIFNRIPFLSSGVVKERLYFSQLYTPYLYSYTEFGYGIGNRFINVAFFTSFHKTKFEEMGLKFSFEYR